jgi:hypothetical protein
MAVPLLALLIACGGGDKDSSSSSGSGDGNTSSSGSQSGSGDDRASGTSSDGDLSLENCKQYASFAASAAGAFASTSSTGAFKIDKNALNDMLKKSPKEIQGDMKIIVDAFVGYVEALDKAGVNLNDPSSFARLDSAKLAQVEAAAEKFDDPKIEAASDRVDAFFTKECS